jgi:hypothetical protein
MQAVALKFFPKDAATLVFFIIGLLFVVLTYLQLNAPISHDVSWYIHVARGVLDGKELYVDFVEVNPPLGMWLTVPIVAGAELVSIHADLALKSVLIVFSAISLLLVNRYVTLSAQWDKSKRLVFMALMALGILFFPGADFGQREHMTVLFFAPWLFLRLAKNAGVRVGVFETCAVGAFAALAISLKPHAMFAPLFVEAFLFWKTRNLRATFSIENIAAGLVVLAYIAIIVVFKPQYISEMIPIGKAAYYPFYGFDFQTQVLIARWGILALVVIFLAIRNLPLRNKIQAQVLFVAALGFMVSYAAQNKGYNYQVLPASIFAWCALATFVAELYSESKKHRTLLSIIAALAPLHIAAEDRVFAAGDAPFISGINQFAPEARSILIASTRVGHGFPLVENLRLKWASRYPTQWITPYVASKWKSGPLPHDVLVRNTMANTVSDLISGQPDIVFIEEATNQYYIPGGRFDYVGFWSNDERFLPFWRNYERRGKVYTFAVFTKKSVAVSTAFRGTFEY